MEHMLQGQENLQGVVFEADAIIVLASLRLHPLTTFGHLALHALHAHSSARDPFRHAAAIISPLRCDPPLATLSPTRGVLPPDMIRPVQ